MKMQVLMFYLPCNFFIIKNASDYGRHFNVIILTRLMLGYNKLATISSLKDRYKFYLVVLELQYTMIN
ncbi:hypothetical protein GCM10011501_05570 [Thalassotalea profundi]|uniref:Uncharacterized protein n=1 Tax=Thalassotalea profundi TaxID=2036687 RepID=A0ABQ3IEE7_9GAMM|nr:hypothetical protein GCM10011501_05570 [Thalassotalea profundi]